MFADQIRKSESTQQNERGHDFTKPKPIICFLSPQLELGFNCKTKLAQEKTNCSRSVVEILPEHQHSGTEVPKDFLNIANPVLFLGSQSTL